MKFNPWAFAFAFVIAVAVTGGDFIGLRKSVALVIEGLALIGLGTVAYYQTRRLD